MMWWAASAMALLLTVKEDLEQLLREMCAEIDCEILALEIMPDHLRLFVFGVRQLAPNQFKLKPTKPQLVAMEQTLEVCRHLHNGALAERRDAWENEKRSVNFAQQCASLPALKEKSAYLPNIVQSSLARRDAPCQPLF